MFGVSITELAMIAAVALVIVGPHKLPQMLRSLGEWIRKLRLFTTEMRAQTGIDEILREEGIEGGLGELRSLMRGDLRSLSTRPAVPSSPAPADGYPTTAELDRSREYPPEGVDAAGVLPDDLVDEEAIAAAAGHDQPLAG